MAFIESPRFPESLSYGFEGGPEFHTTIAEYLDNGWEDRNADWSHPRYRFAASKEVNTPAQMKAVREFFLAVAKGRANSFRFQDPEDFEVSSTEGKLGGGVGAGVPAYQMHKRYSAGSNIYDRRITKPVTGTAVVYREAAPVTVGVAAGNIAIDYTTGIVTFVADATTSASAITVGATTQVTLAANLGLTAGMLLYLIGFTGADAALVNGLAHTINSVTGSGPYTFTLATDTAGKTITLGSGAGHKYPQVTDDLTFACQFDVPVRLDVDHFASTVDSYGTRSLQDCPLVEDKRYA